jgi:hypothetical protein
MVRPPGLESPACSLSNSGNRDRLAGAEGLGFRVVKDDRRKVVQTRLAHRRVAGSIERLLNHGFTEVATRDA